MARKGGGYDFLKRQKELKKQKKRKEKLARKHAQRSSSDEPVATEGESVELPDEASDPSSASDGSEEESTDSTMKS